MAGDLQRGLPVLRVFDDAMPRKAANPSTKNPPIPKLHAELRELILSARERVAQTVNSGLTLLYWQVGDRIRRHVLREKRAAYGEEIVSALATQLAEEFGAGFSRRNLFNMVRFSEVFSDFEIVQALTAQLGWTHFTHIIRLEDTLKREFYAEMCRIERWSTRALEQKIQSMLFERTALSKKPEKLAQQELAALREHDLVSPDLVFRDPYVLGFLGLKDSYAEKDLESAILREIEAFLVELGRGFTFVARQKRMAAQVFLQRGRAPKSAESDDGAATLITRTASAAMGQQTCFFIKYFSLGEMRNANGRAGENLFADFGHGHVVEIRATQRVLLMR
jgi:predicted nuclease of restriction endonuclease-like (RecB) superfamily